MRSLQELIEKHQQRLNDVVDPDACSWDDLGFDEPPEGFNSPLEFQRLHGECDETGQSSEALIGEFIEDLKALQGLGDGSRVQQIQIKKSTRVPALPKRKKSK